MAADDFVTRRLTQLAQAAELETDDLLMFQRGDGPAQAAPVGAMMTYMEENGVGAGNAAAAAASAVLAEADKVQTGLDRAAVEAVADDIAAMAGAHTVDMAGDADEFQPVYGLAAAGASASDRWYYELQGANLYIENVHTAIAWNGGRTKAATVRTGRTAAFRLDYSATNFSAAAGVGIAFDDGLTTGADAVLSAAAVIIGVRAGTVVIESPAGASVAAGYTITKTSVATMPVAAGGDAHVLSIDLGTPEICTITLQEGPAFGTYTISPRPPGQRFIPVTRLGVGTGTAHPAGANPRALMYPMTWSDPTSTTNVTTLETTAVIGSPAAAFLADWGSPVTYVAPDPYATVARVRPPGWPSLPVMLIAVNGPGAVVCDADMIAAYCAIWPEVLSNGIAYVSKDGGAPGAGALNDPSKPFTPNYALQSTPAQLVVQLDGVADPIDFRATHTYGHLRKLYVARNRGSAIWAITPADDITEVEITAHGVYAGVWQFNYAGAYGGTAIHRLVRRDVLDDKSFPDRFPQLASAAAVNAASRGYYVDTAAKTVFMKWDGEDLSAVQAYLKAYWLDAAGNSRAVMIGTTLGVSGMVLDGVAVTTLAGAETQPELWIDNCLQVFAPTYGIGEAGVAGTRVFASRLRMHASQYDGININPGVVGTALGQVVRSYITNAGDYAAFQGAGGAFMQGFSLHGGRMARWGNRVEDCYGAQFSDASTDPAANGSWDIANLAIDNTGLVPVGGQGFAYTGHAGDGVSDRDIVAHLDTCEARGSAMTTPLLLGQGASAKVFNSPTLLPAAVSDGSSQPVAYTPDAP